MPASLLQVLYLFVLNAHIRNPNPSDQSLQQYVILCSKRFKRLPLPSVACLIRKFTTAHDNPSLSRSNLQGKLQQEAVEFPSKERLQRC